MPTELPPRKTARPQATPEGNLFFAGAVVMMLAISVVIAVRAERTDASAGEAQVETPAP